MQNQPSVTDCPVALTLSVIGSSWTCLILRDLLLHGARRFQDLQISLVGIAPTTLSDRLRTLEQNGVVERRFYSMSRRGPNTCLPKRVAISVRLLLLCVIGGASTRGDRLLSETTSQVTALVGSSRGP